MLRLRKAAIKDLKAIIHNLRSELAYTQRKLAELGHRHTDAVTRSQERLDIINAMNAKFDDVQATVAQLRKELAIAKDSEERARNRYEATLDKLITIADALARSL